MEWLVRLEGDDWSLKDLSEWFNHLGHKVMAKEGGYYLSSSAFEECATSREVFERAEQIIERINGAARAFEPQFRPVQISSEILEFDDITGARRLHHNLRAAKATFQPKFHTATLLMGGTPLPPQPSKPERVVKQWEVDGHESAFGRALRIGLLPQTWGALYHVYEVIKHDMSGGEGGKDTWKALLPLFPELSEPELNHQLSWFRDTANDPKLAGIHARHGRPQPKVKLSCGLMPLAEAQNLIRQLLQAWLARKI